MAIRSGQNGSVGNRSPGIPDVAVDNQRVETGTAGVTQGQGDRPVEGQQPSGGSVPSDVVLGADDLIQREVVGDEPMHCPACPSQQHRHAPHAGSSKLVLRTLV